MRRLYFLLSLHQLRRFERLPIVSNLGDADSGVVLPVPTQLLVLFLALVMEDKNFVSASLLDNLAGHECLRSRGRNVTRLSRNCEHVAKGHASVLVSLLFHPDHIAWGDAILLSTCADHRVHRLSY